MLDPYGPASLPSCESSPTWIVGPVWILPTALHQNNNISLVWNPIGVFSDALENIRRGASFGLGPFHHLFGPSQFFSHRLIFHESLDGYYLPY